MPSQLTDLVLGRHIADAVEFDDVTSGAAGLNGDIDDMAQLQE
jgi:hypothetical protein